MAAQYRAQAVSPFSQGRATPTSGWGIRTQSAETGSPQTVAPARQTMLQRANNPNSSPLSSSMSGSGRISTVTGNSVPVPVRRSPRPKRWMGRIPQTMSQARSKSHSAYAGISQFENTITWGVVVEPWVNDLHRDIWEGQLLMAHTTRGNLERTIVLNLRNVNQYLRDKYRAGDELFRRIASDEELSVAGFNSEHARQLGSLSVRTWSSHRAMVKALSTKDDMAQLLAYLDIHWCLRIWNFYGVALGQISQDLDVVSFAVGRAGVIEEGENGFPTGKPGESMYLILKRQFDEETGEYGAFQFHPWSGESQPPMSEKYYKDYTGNDAYGVVLHIGRVLWWNRNGRKKFSDKLLEIHNGLRDAEPHRRFTGPSGRESKFVLGASCGKRHYFLC